jgi:hypothetical protein
MSVGGGSRSLYARVLRLRHLRLRPLVAFLLFEGSVAFAILLVLADLIDGWGVVAIPAAVAVMVKVNDVVAGALDGPVSGAHVRPPRPRDRSAVGRSRVPYPAGRAGVGLDGGEVGQAEDGGGEARPPRAPDGREPRTWAIARVVARGRATVRSSRSSEATRPDGADRRSRGNTGRFGG